ncbi:uncharacterized protein LOC143902676 [Temnothorax americanus]|uniref:uncharacterized protein LOC143902676 n=1 Tax=Temnothorax americanus TaxID=1964332 RepID=UPI0040688E5B
MDFYRRGLSETLTSQQGRLPVPSDNGTEFVNRVIKGFAEEHGITHTTVPPYHLQANPVKRVNRTLKTMIVSFIERDHREWDKYLPQFRFTYNTASHSSLGASPAFVNLGRKLVPPNLLRDRVEDVSQVEPRDPTEWTRRMTELRAIREWLAENMDQANQRQAANYNLRRRPRRFRIGDLVLRRQHVLSSAAHNIAEKLSFKFQGPLRVRRVISPVVYELTQLDGSTVGKMHVKDVKPYYPLVPDL